MAMFCLLFRSALLRCEVVEVLLLVLLACCVMLNKVDKWLVKFARVTPYHHHGGNMMACSHGGVGMSSWPRREFFMYLTGFSKNFAK